MNNVGVGNPNCLPDWNSDQTGVTFMKVEPMSPCYSDPYAANVPSSQGATAMFTNSHGHSVERQGIVGFQQSGLSPFAMRIQPTLSQQQPVCPSTIASGSVTFAGSATGNKRHQYVVMLVHSIMLI